MASKVEELRELRDALDDLIETEATKILTAHQFLELPGFDKIMDAIVAAAHAEGVAEGAEQERERIRKWLYEPDPANAGYHIHINILGELEFITPFDLLSVLAPTKGSGK